MLNRNNIWDKMAKSFHLTSSRSKAHKDKYSVIANLVMKSNLKSVIDLGCGSGLLENELIKAGYKGDIFAVDASTEMLKIAKNLCKGNVNFIQSNLDEELNLSKKFDIVVAINVLFFMKDKIKFLSAVSNLLANKSSIFILVNPKPENECGSNWQFIKAHYSDTSFFEKVYITFNEISNIPYYIRMAHLQSHVSKMAKNGLISFDSIEGLKQLSKKSGLEILSFEDVHARQNWLVKMRSSRQ